LLLVVEILEKKFTKLCSCLPQDYTRTVDNVKHALPGISDAYLHSLSMLLSTDLINKIIIRQMILNVKEICDAVKFCMILRHFTEDNNFVDELEDGMQSIS